MSATTKPATTNATTPPIMAEGSDAVPFLGNCAVGVIISRAVSNTLYTHHSYPCMIIAEFGTLTIIIIIYATALSD